MDDDTDSAPGEEPDREPGARDSEFPESDKQEASRKKLENIIRDVVKRGVEKSISAGVGTWTKTDSAFRDIVGDVKLPREVASYVFSSVDDTKNALVRVVAGEVRDFLEATDVAQEVKKALTTLSFEIKTEIRFIPNDSGGVKPDVKASISPKRDRKKRKTEPPTE